MTKLEAMQRGGKINREVMLELFSAARPGVSLKELNDLAERLIREAGGVPSFKGYDGFPAAICVNVNETLIHGLPTDYRLKENDVLTIDQGVLFAGFHTDHALTREIAGAAAQSFLEVGELALKRAISQALVGSRVGDISHAIQSTVEAAGYFVVKSYVGHGVGRDLHEAPQIPCFGKPDTGAALAEGQTIAIEVMYISEQSKLSVARDGWTIVAKDANLAALFERTVMVRRKNPIILT